VGALSVGGANDAVRDASLADVMRNDELASSTAKARACMALGMIAGPLLGGVAAKRNVRLPFVVASVASLGGAVLCGTQLVETLAPERQRECAESQDSNGGTFAPEHCLNPVSSIELLRRSPKLRWLTVACALSMGSEYVVRLVHAPTSNRYRCSGSRSHCGHPKSIALPLTLLPTRSVCPGLTQTSRLCSAEIDLAGTPSPLVNSLRPAALLQC
jgi:MFS family permease